MILSRDIFSAEAKHSNMVFSPASIYSALTLAASGPGDPSVVDEILSFLKSSSIDELNSVFTEIGSVVYASGSANGCGPEISSINGVWIEQSLPNDPKFKDRLVSIPLRLLLPLTASLISPYPDSYTPLLHRSQNPNFNR